MEKFFRLCPGCQQFFYSRNDFLSHHCAHAESEITGDHKKDGTVKIPRHSPDSEDKKEERRQLRKQYIGFLKKKGVHMESERSFKKIEEAYRKHSEHKNDNQVEV